MNTTPKRSSIKVFLALITLTAPSVLCAQSTPVAVPPPPMGWSSWNAFSNTVDSQIVMAQAKAMASTGLQKAGYQHINIDEGWWLGQRDTAGNIIVDPKAWPALQPGEQPGDMGNIVHFIHRLGLKAGIYTDAGTDGCSTVGPDLGPSYPNTGSENHYEQDFLQFAKWGFDYVKIDWCGGNKEHLDPAVQYAEIARAIARAEVITGHHIYFSICNWGNQSPWTWAPNIGGVAADIWRTGGDIVAPIVAGTKNAGRKAELKEVLREFDQGHHPDAQHTGFYNDLDMMVVGMPGLTDAQNRVHMGLWAISGSPLILGADLTKLTTTDLDILTNPDVLAIDQDPLGVQSLKAAEPTPGLQVWYKPLATQGERAVLLLNRTASSAQIAVRWADIGLSEDSPATVRDLWSRKDLGQFNGSYSATVSAGDAILLAVLGGDAPMTLYTPEEANQQLPTPTASQQFTFTRVASRFPVARIRIAYANPGKSPRFAELRVNDRIATRIAFPPTGSGSQAGTISVESTLETTSNTLIFSTPTGLAPAIQSISLQ